MDIRYEKPLDELSLKHVRDLGQGTYGSVSLKVHPCHQYYAKKTSSIKTKENLKKEVRIMLRFRNHPRIVQALSDRIHLGMLLKDCYIFMEYASEGTLGEIITGFRGKPLPENVIGRSTRQILQGLEALHSQGYVHCDLKPHNILLFPSTTFGEFWDIKIADFGLSKEPHTDNSRFSFPGTKWYMPPESVGPDGVVSGPALDIWSLGCIVFEMFGGKPVKMDDSSAYVWKLDQDISPVAIDFLRKCHAWYPSNRASATELLNHPFILQRVSRFVLPTIPITPPSPKKQQDLKYPLIFRKRITGPLPTPIGPPTRRQQEAANKVTG